MKLIALLIALLATILVGCSDTPAPTLVERRIEPYDTYWDLAVQCEGMGRREAVALLREVNGNVTLIAGRTVLVCGTTTTSTSTTTTTTSTSTSSTSTTTSSTTVAPIQLGEASVCELGGADYSGGVWTAADGHIIGHSDYEDSEIRDSAGRLVCPPLD